jgi:2-polyprenyl-3-methyl-5-hydroxy-6-metoxy-1,4-benzoquinol methylase
MELSRMSQGKERIALDKAGKPYWNQVWEGCDVLNTIDPRKPGLRNHVPHRFHLYFHRLFSGRETRGLRLLEIGCASSVWLPYFAKEFGFTIYGIDYSEVGCAQAEELLQKAGVEGEILCADFFTPPGRFIEAFDVVISFGVVEHFHDTPGCLRAFSRFLKTGGLLVTNVPNLSGMNGMIQKMVNRPIYDIHVPLDRKQLIHAHQTNGLRMMSCDYFIFVNLGVLKFENWKGHLLYPGACRLRSLLNVVAWMCERAIPLLKPNRWSSPYINCLAVKAGASGDGSLFAKRS